MTTLTVTKSGSGTGRVRSLLGGIDCGNACNSQSANYGRTAQVILVATPSAGSHFTGWSGDGSNVNVPGQDSVCRLVGMSRDRTVGLGFNSGTWALPDLVVQSLRFVPDRLRVEFKVRNIGGLPSNAGRVHVRIEQMRIVSIGNRPRALRLESFTQEQEVATLLPGKATRLMAQSFTLAPQLDNWPLADDSSLQARVFVTADSGNTSTESSETNNVAFLLGVRRNGVYA